MPQQSAERRACPHHGPAIFGRFPKIDPPARPDHGVRRFRTSACRRPAPLHFFSGAENDEGHPAPFVNRAAEPWLFDK
jgi:hypothetical protein